MTMQADPTTAAVIQAAVHELRGPASRLRLLVQLLGRSLPELDEDSRALFKHVEDSAGAVGTVAEALRNYSEILSRPLQCAPVNLNLAVSACVANLQPEMAAAGASVECGELPEIFADPFLMTWLLSELIANAIRFRGSASPSIRVSAEGKAVLVADNGPGIAAEFSERVFRPFLKLSSCGGVGLGLTICRKILELHGGRIWVEPRTGGAELRFLVNCEPRGETACG